MVGAGIFGIQMTLQRLRRQKGRTNVTHVEMRQNYIHCL